MKQKQSHIHKLKRLIHKSGTAVFFCVLDCSYKISTPLALGKRSICWRCNSEFLMNEYCLRLAKPHCPECHKPKRVILENGSIIEFGPVNEKDKYVGLDNPFTLIEPERLSLSERLTQTIQNAKQQIEEDEL